MMDTTCFEKKQRNVLHSLYNFFELLDCLVGVCDVVSMPITALVTRVHANILMGARILFTCISDISRMDLINN